MNAFRPKTFVCQVALLLTLLQWLPVASVVAQQPGREQFVPASELNAVFERSPRGVVIPREEFNKLLEQAQAAFKANAALPSDVVLRAATYEVSQQDEHALIDLELEIQQFADRWVSVSIPVGNLQLEDARIGNDVAAVRATSDAGTILFLHRHAGRFTLSLKLSTPLGVAGADRLAAIRLLPQVPATMIVQCPPNRFLQVDDQELVRPAPVQEATQYTFPVGSSDHVRLKWTTRRESTEMQTLIFCRSDVTVQLNTDTLRWNSATRVSVYGNRINQLVARVPSRLEVTSVDSQGLESWKLEDDPEDPDLTRVLLNYRQPFQDDRMIQLSAVAPVNGQQPVDVPTLEFLNVTAHAGRILATRADGLRLSSKAENGIRHEQSDSGEGQAASGGSLQGEVFDFWLQDYQLSVAVRPRDRELFAQINSILNITDSTASLTVSATIETLNQPSFDFTLQTPSDWQVLDVAAPDGRGLTWRRVDDGHIEVIPDQAVATGELLTIVAKFQQPLPDPETARTLGLPVVTVADALAVSGTYSVASQSDLLVTPVEINGLAPIADEEEILLFETQATEWSGTLQVQRRTARLAARSVVRSWQTDRQKTVELTTTVDVLSGTVRQMTLLLSEDLGPDVSFTVASIDQVPGMTDQQVPATLQITEQRALDVQDGRRPFELTFDRRFAGAVTLQATVDRPREEDGRLAAPVIAVSSATRQHGLVVFEAYPTQQLTAEDDGQHLRPADAAMVTAPANSTDRRIALVFRFVRPDYRLTVKEVEFETAAVPSAVCETLSHASVLSEAGTVQRSCTATFYASGVQTLQFVLPEADRSHLWSTVLNGEPIEVRREDDRYLVAIPPSDASTEHRLTLLFETDGLSDANSGRLDQQSVEFFVAGEGGDSIPVEVLLQDWQMHYPDGTQLVDYEGGFVPTVPPDQPGWLIALRDDLRLPSVEQAIRFLVPLGVFALCLFVLTVVIVRRRWKTLALLVVVAIGGVSLLLSAPYSRVASSLSPRSGEVDSEADSAPMVWSTDEAMDAEGGWVDDADFQVDLSMAIPEAAQAGGGFGGGGAFGGAMGGMEAMDGRGRGEQVADFPADAADSSNRFGDANHPFSRSNQSNGVVDAVQGLPVVPREMPLEEAEALFESGGEIAAGRQLSGAARLSVVADLEVPEGFQHRRFRSIGTSADATQLQISLQTESRLHAIRWLAAAVTLLICIWIRTVPAFNRLLFIILVTVLVCAALPLAPAVLQPALDGILLGLAGGIVYWILRAVVGVFRNLTAAARRAGRAIGAARKSVSTAALLFAAMTVGFATDVQAQESLPKPDVLLSYPDGEPPLTAQKVFLPRDQFLQLYRLAYPDRLPTPDNQQGASVVAAFFESQQRRQVKDEQWSQAFRVRLVVQTFQDAAVVDLPFGPVALRSVQIDGVDAALLTGTDPPSATQNPNAAAQQEQQAAQQKLNPAQPQPDTAAPYQVRIAEAGLHVLDVVLEVPASLQQSVGSFRLLLRPVPVGSLTFELPAEELTARVNGRSNAFRRTDNRLIVPLAGLNQLSLEWMPGTESGGNESVFHADVRSALVLDDTGQTLHSQIALTRRQGTLTEVEIQIPQRMAVQSVEGSDVAGWNVIEGDPRRLKVVFREDVQTSSVVRLTMFERVVFGTDDKTIDVPIPAVPAATRDSGYVAVVAPSELEVRVQSLSGVGQINAQDAELPDSVGDKSRVALAWRYTRQPAEVEVRVFRPKDKADVTVLHGVQLEAQRQLWTTLAAAEISGSPRRRLELQVPNDFVVLDVSAHDLQDWYLTEQDGQPKLLTVQFANSRRGTVSVVVQAQRGVPSVADEVRLQPPQVMDASELSSQVSVWLSDLSVFQSFSADGWQRVSGRQLLHQQLQKLKSEEPAVSFTSQQKTPADIVLQLRQKPVMLSPESVMVTTVTDTSQELTLALNWQTDNAVRHLSFTLPETLRNAFEFQIPGLRQLNVVEGDDGRDTYHIHLQQSVKDRFFLLGTATLPLPADRQIQPQSPAFIEPPDSPIRLSPQSHFWVLVNQSSGLLKPLQNADRTDDVLPEDIRLPESYLQQSVAIQRLSSEQPAPVWQLSFPEAQQVAPAVITLAEHTTVFAVDGSWRSKHQLQVRNESRQYLPVAIPADSRFLACTVDGRPARVVQYAATAVDGDSETSSASVSHLIPVPQSGIAAAPITVEFVLAGRMSGIRPDLDGARLDVPVPVFPDYRDDAEHGVTVARNTWQVYLPERWTASVEDDPRATNMIPAADDDLEDASLMSVIDNARSSVSVLKSSKNRLLVDSLYSELQDQREMLSRQRGNSGQSESQRQQALNEIQEQIIQLDDFAVPQAAEEPSAIAGNRFLLQMDSEVNTSNSANAAQLFFYNGKALSADKAKAAQDGAFNFELLEKDPAKEQPGSQQGQNQSAPGKKSEAKSRSMDRKKSENRSKLIEQRGLNLQQQFRQTKPQRRSESAAGSVSGAFDVPALSAPAQPSTATARSAGQQIPAPPIAGPPNSQVTNDVAQAAPEPISDRDGQGQGGAQAAVPQGTLSLAFDLPTEGTRYDFIRGSGNPELALQIRSRESVRTGFGLLWAAGCFVVLFLLLKADSVAGLAFRLAVLATLGGVAMVLLLTGPPQVLGLMLCASGLILISLMLIVGSFLRGGPKPA